MLTAQATRSRGKASAQVLLNDDLQVTDESEFADDFLGSASYTKEERQILRRNMLAPRLLQKIENMNSTLQAQRRAAGAADGVPLGLFGPSPSEQAAENARVFQKRKTEAKRLLRDIILPAGESFRADGSPTFTMKPMEVSSIYSYDSDREQDVEDDEDENGIHFYRFLNHYYYDPEELVYFIEHHRDVLYALNLPERRKLLVENIIGRSAEELVSEGSRMKADYVGGRYQRVEDATLGLRELSATGAPPIDAANGSWPLSPRHAGPANSNADLDMDAAATSELMRQLSAARARARALQIRVVPEIDTTVVKVVECPAGSFCPPGSVGQQNTDGSVTMLSATPCNIEGVVCTAGSSIPLAVDTPILPGQYVDEQTGLLMMCPPGYACPPGGGTPQACPPGQFLNDAGGGECSTCTAGTVCLGFGAPLPALCPAGQVCVNPGRSESSFECPAGSYCMPGTFTMNTQASIPPGLARPVVCPVGTYCLAGTGTFLVDDLRQLVIAKGTWKIFFGEYLLQIRIDVVREGGGGGVEWRCGDSMWGGGG